MRFAVVFERALGAFVRIAVAAAVRAAVVGANVAAFYTVAATALAFVFAGLERDAVRRAKHLERHAAARPDAIARPVDVCAAGLQQDAMRGGDASQPRGDAVHVVDAHDDELGHVEFELAVDFHEGEDAAVDVAGELAAQVVERFEVPLDRVIAREENGVVAPADALGSDDSLEFVQRLDGVVDRRNARLDVGPYAVMVYWKCVLNRSVIVRRCGRRGA